MGAAQRILDLERAFMQAAEPKRTEGQIPLPVLDLGEAHVFLAEGLTDIDPLLVPANAAVAAHAAHFIMAGILEGREPARIGPRRWGIVRRRRIVREGLMGAHVVVLSPPGIEAPLLGARSG